MDSEVSNVILICSGECKRGNYLFNAVHGEILKNVQYLRSICKGEGEEMKTLKKGKYHGHGVSYF